MKIKAFPIILSSLLLSSCASNLNPYEISFKEYTEIVKNACKGQQDIFIFSSSNCHNCQALSLSIEKYIANNTNENLNIYILSVDYKASFNGTISFKDKTMGLISGDSNNDCIERLDNRLQEYMSIVYSDKNYPQYIFEGDSKNSEYLFVYTPLFIWYESGIEVKVANNVLNYVKTNENGKVDYDSFVSFMEFPDENPSWNKEFDLQYYTKK